MAKKAKKPGKGAATKKPLSKDKLGREIANRGETLTAAEIESLAREFYQVYELLHDCASFMEIKKVAEIQAIVSGLRKKARESQKLANSQIGRKVDEMAIEMGIADRLSKFKG
ncbi:hypothetical protein DTL21_06310 [Bremerella cremea]|uniref:Uncharacterized protein n=1 Tax=Blastopirellula marina TaxID=124 RepID=A0A2S8G089_9BACT|nr:MULTISPECIES: hypothetical protein [Pirellulaceae]PQO37554.1 hypothetical protein C5Y83_06310 [Blastopirellula marina]RCS49941.1 hypothetical protein DTL21_06310 [Bremerella cremea]